MAVGFGIEPQKNTSGAVTAGTTESDIRRIYGALYAPGLISGGAVTTSASAMTYTVSAGVAAFKISSNETVLGPIPQTTVNASQVGGNSHIVYAYQNTVAVDGNPEVVIKVGATLPSVRAVRLASFMLPVGATNSSQGTRNSNVDWSIPYGASLGILTSHQDTLNGTFTTAQTVATKTFYLPTDREVSFSVQTTVSASAGSGFDNANYCQAGYSVILDGKTLATFGTNALTSAWSWEYFAHEENVAAGNHTVSLTRGRSAGPGTPKQWYGAGAYKGLKLIVRDEGVVK